MQKFRNKFIPENEIDSINKHSASAILSENSFEKIKKEFLKINQTALTALSFLRSRIVAMSFCEPRSWRDILSS